MAKSNNIVSILQRWMDSVPGQTFLNYAYSWGAAVVILGTLFKLTHMEGADIMLIIGMGTEVFVFFLGGFDRPFSKQDKQSDLPDDYVDEDEDEQTTPSITLAQPVQPVQIVQPIYQSTEEGQTLSSQQPMGQPQPVTPQPSEQYTQPIPMLSSDSSSDMAVATQSYVDRLRELTEVLGKVSEQSVRLTRDSEEMEQLNRTLTSINTIYEMQLKGISKQVSTIDQINDQTRRMAQQIVELNSVYDRMIKALTINMGNAAGTTTPQP